MPTTNLDVIDTGVKIGLGSTITLVGTYLVTWLNHKNDHKKDIRKRLYDSLEIITKDIDEMTHISLKYWAIIIELVRYRTKGEDLSGSRYKELETIKVELAELFKHLTIAESKLMLLGLNDIAKLVREYGEFLKSMRRTNWEGNDTLTEDGLEDVRLGLLNKREKLFAALSASYIKGL